MPNDTIDRGIKKAAGDAGMLSITSIVTYEGYGPSGIAIIVDALTDNKNRTAANVTQCIYQRQRKHRYTGLCILTCLTRKGRSSSTKKSARWIADELMMLALDAGAEDFSEEEDSFEDSHRSG